PLPEVFGEVAGRVACRVDGLAGGLVIARLHDAIVIASFVVTPDMQNMDQARVIEGDRHVFLNAPELPRVGFGVREIAVMNDFDGVIGANNVSGQPDLAIGALPDAPQQVMVWNER